MKIMKTTSFDRLSHATDAKGFIVLCILLRFAMAGLFLYAAWSKWNTPDWSAAGYLNYASGPFAAWFQSLAGNTVVDGLVVYGQILIGLAFLSGLFIKPAAFFGALMMMLFYVSGWTTNTAHGLVDQHVIYTLVCGLFLYGEFGHWYGLDYFVSRTKFVQSREWLFRLF
jgi:thiosulfate dehydrogenase (quinone) large subunit